MQCPQRTLVSDHCGGAACVAALATRYAPTGPERTIMSRLTTTANAA